MTSVRVYILRSLPLYAVTSSFTSTPSSRTSTAATPASLDMTALALSSQAPMRRLRTSSGRGTAVSARVASSCSSPRTTTSSSCFSLLRSRSASSCALSTSFFCEILLSISPMSACTVAESPCSSISSERRVTSVCSSSRLSSVFAKTDSTSCFTALQWLLTFLRLLLHSASSCCASSTFCSSHTPPLTISLTNSCLVDISR
mmetsp:Transcript_67851/g.99224  ORF Transcript_67851/g.99224 Transcript_67851/m.99224 type:complete len:202 (-) Transcript_67851:174-779(-)